MAILLGIVEMSRRPPGVGWLLRPLQQFRGRGRATATFRSSLRARRLALAAPACVLGVPPGNATTHPAGVGWLLRPLQRFWGRGRATARFRSSLRARRLALAARACVLGVPPGNATTHNYKNMLNFETIKLKLHCFTNVCSFFCCFTFGKQILNYLMN